MLAVAPSTQLFADDSANDIAFFEKKIRPVLIKHCYECHSAEAVKAGDLASGLEANRVAQNVEHGRRRAVHSRRESLRGTVAEQIECDASVVQGAVEPTRGKGQPAAQRLQRVSRKTW